MRRAGLAVACLILSVSQAGAASFDCAKASRPADKLICSDPALSQADSTLADAYKRAMSAQRSDADRAALREAQRAWIAGRDAKCLRNASAVACMKTAYDLRIATLTGRSQPQAAPAHVDVTPLDDSALTAAYPADRSEMGFPDGVFSPRGDLFAFAVSNIVSGDADQIWLYDLAHRKLVAASPPPVKGKISYAFQGFFFANGTLYVSGTTMPEGDAQEPFQRAATLAGNHAVASVPPVPVIPGAARDTTAVAGDELTDGGDKRVEDGRYAVTSKNQGHGAFVLSARAQGSNREWTIEAGGYGLTSFVLDAKHERVLYADNSGHLAVYDLKSRATTATIPVVIDSLLDVTADGRLAAYVANGPCDPAKPRARQQSVCFVKLP